MHKIYTCRVKKLFYKKLVGKIMRKSYKYRKKCAEKLSFNSYVENIIH